MSLRGCLSRLPLRRPLTRRPCVRACCWFALLLLVLQIVLPVGAGRAAAEERGGSSQNRKQMWSANGKRTGKHPCTRQDLSAARRLQKVAINQLETAQQAVKTAQQAVETLQKVWLQEFEARGNTEEAKEAEAKVEKAKQEREKAKEVAFRSRRPSRSTRKPSRSARRPKRRSRQDQRRPRGFCASACAVVAVAVGLQHSRLHCVGLQHFGEWEGLSAERVLAASGFTQVWLSFVFYRALVLAVRLEVRVYVALRLQLFLRMRFRLLYLCLCAWPPFSVVICWDLARRARRWGPSRL